MYSKEDIVARLQNGETMDSILNEMTNTINAANDEYNARKAKEEAEKALAAEKAKAHDAKKAALAADIRDAFIAYFEFCAPGLLGTVDESDAMIGELMKSLDMTIELGKKLADLIKLDNTPVATIQVNDGNEVNVDDIFNAFYKKYNLI